MATSRDHQPVTLGAQAFLDGRSNTVTSADVDPQGAEAFARYEKALSLKASGDLSTAAALLELSCSPPSIYKGHYRELFKIWRQLNRAAAADGQHKVVIDRVRKMAQLDEELIREMLKHWSHVQQRSLPADYFDSDRNLLVSDVRALKKAAEACRDDNSNALAKALLSRLSADA